MSFLYEMHMELRLQCEDESLWWKETTGMVW